MHPRYNPRRMKITAYVVNGGRIEATGVPSPNEIPERAVWVDVLGADNEQMRYLGELLGLHVSLEAAELDKDVYGHVEVEAGQLMMTMRAERLAASDGLPNAKGLVVLSAEKLVTFRNGSVPAIEAASHSASGVEASADPRMQLTVHLLVQAMKLTSKALDSAEAEVHGTARALLSNAEAVRAEVDLERVLSALSRLQVKMVALRYRHRLVSRVVDILVKDRRFSLVPELQQDLELALSDALSLRDFASSIDEQLSRLMDSTMGFIGLRQNASARWFSIVATVFMPPTLLGAIWGMNFKYMPELDERYAYVLALGLMLLSATIPLWVVKRMGWFRN